MGARASESLPGALDADLGRTPPGAEQAIRTDRIENGVHGRCPWRHAPEEQAGAVRDVPGVGCGEERDEGSAVPAQPLVVAQEIAPDHGRGTPEVERPRARRVLP